MSKCLSYRNLNFFGDDLITISLLLRNNDDIVKLDLTDNNYYCDVDIIKHLSISLKYNKNLKYLNLENNYFEQGFNHIFDGLKFNNTLLHLNISNINTDNNDIKCLVDYLKNNSSLTHLTIRNTFGELNILLNSLIYNKTLKYLDISDSDFINISFDFLLFNKSLNTLIIQVDYNFNNHLDNVYIKELFEILKTNRTLSRLNILDNDLDSDILNFISESLEFNKTLVELSLNKYDIECNKIENKIKNNILYQEQNIQLKKLYMYLYKSEIYISDCIISDLNIFLSKI